MLYTGSLGRLQRLARKILASSQLVRSTTASARIHEATIRSFQKKANEPNAVVFVGSSSIRLWKSLEADMAPLTVVNRGFGGAHTAHVRHFADRLVHIGECSAPRAIVYYAGDNDIAAGIPPELAVQQVRAFLEWVAGRAPVIVLSAKYSPLRMHLSPELVALNDGLRSECARFRSVRFLDVASALLTENGEADESCFMWDGLHLSAEGYRRWTAIVKPAVEALVGRQS